MYEDTRDGLIFFAVVALAIGVICGGVGTVDYFSEKWECANVHTNTGAETKFVKNSIVSWDCYVKADGSWIPLDKWRGVN